MGLWDEAVSCLGARCKVNLNATSVLHRVVASATAGEQRATTARIAQNVTLAGNADTATVQVSS
jgi:hypothetical protein